MLISQGNLRRDSLKGEVAVVTGAGRGVGYEAARALVWLGANVALAEIDEKSGQVAAENLGKEFGSERVFFVKTDVGKDRDVERLRGDVLKKWGKIDVVLNNATVFPMGSVVDTSVEKWDFSYSVNLRGPVLLARAFLPDMIKRRHGVFVCVSSSGAAPYMGAYEVFKTAQGELADTIAAEVEGTGVYAFTIGPGIVRTPGFIEGGGKVAAYMGISLEQLIEINRNFEITPEAAGAGFAAAIALASKYHGQETSSIQVLREIGISIGSEDEEEEAEVASRTVDKKKATELHGIVLKTLVEQSDGWKKRNVFQRQWVLRDFKKTTGVSVDEMLASLHGLGDNLATGAPTARFMDSLNKLGEYSEHQKELLKGFERNPKRLQVGLDAIDGWTRDIKALLDALKS